jgi:homoserine O-acetyltransferase/O-succinyltransferase
MRPLSLLAALTLATPAAAQGVQGDYTARNFKFVSGESLPELRLHYTTLGTPRKDAAGTVRNAVMVLHGTGGTGRGFLSANWAGELFGPGKLLDTARYYVVLPDDIGHGGSSKPSNGLHAKFPQYDYDDMVNAEHLLLTEGLKVNHLRLIMGTSMGCMHAWMWGSTYPAFVDGLVPLACAPTQIAGRNRMIRRMIMDDITESPDYIGGEYTAEPHGLRAAIGQLYIMSSAPLVQQKQAPTRDKADSVIHRYIDNAMKTTDANDMLYYFNSSRNYDPSPHLERITTPVLAINSADDFVNPPELGIVEKLIARVPHVTFVMVPISDQTHGHGTHSWPAVWDSHLKDFLATLPER